MRGMHRGWEEAANWLDKHTNGYSPETVADMRASYPWNLEEKLTLEAMRIKPEDM